MTEDEAKKFLQIPRSETPLDHYRRLTAHAVLLREEGASGGGQHSIRVIAAALADVCAKLAVDI